MRASRERFREAMILLQDAERAARMGQDHVASGLLAQAREGSEAVLRGLGVEPSTCTGWAVLGAICELGPVSRSRTDFLEARVNAASRCLEHIAGELDQAFGSAELGASLAGAYESLLDQVWQCEREWEFDDRIALATLAGRAQSENARRLRQG